MTMPHLQNCPHKGDGWCLPCVKELYEELTQVNKTPKPLVIDYIKGNIFDSTCDAIVNTVNCVGVMGKGLALQFKQRYPEMFSDYQKACQRGEVQIGRMWLWKHERLIINFPTKYHWWNPSRIDWIIEGLIDLERVIKKERLDSIAIPALGCQNGGLKFDDVRKELEAFRSKLSPNIIVSVYLP